MSSNKLFLVFLVPVLSFSQNWQQLANLSAAARDDGSAFVIGNTVYCGLGNAQGIGPSSDLYRFDPLNDIWTSYLVAPLPAIGRQYCSSFSYNQYGFIIGGVDANWNATNEVWRYDTTNNSWQQRTSMPDSLFGSLCFFINNKAYVCGGRDQNNQGSRKVWEYDVVNDNWMPKNDMSFGPRWRSSGAVINNKGYLGFGADSMNKFKNKLYEYDPTGDSWLLLDSFPGQGRTYAVGGAVNNFLAFGLGIDSANLVYNDFYLYDVVAKQWLSQAPLPSAGRKGCISFVHNNNLYVTTGMDGALNRLAETWKVSNITLIANHSNIQKLSIYPDPASDHVMIELPGTTADLIISNAIGVEVLKLPGPMEGRIELDVNNFPGGIYFLYMRGGQSGYSGKFIIRR